MTLTRFAFLCLGCLLSFGAGVVFNKQAVAGANEAKLEAEKAFADAKSEWQKFKAGAKHRLDEIFS